MRIGNGYSACLARDDAGWYAGILVIDDIDGPFLPGGSVDYTEAVHKSRHWQEAFARVGRRVILAREDGSPREISLAERVCGPACPKENAPSPILAWTQRGGSVWELVSLADGFTRTVTRSRSVLRNPQVALTRDGPIFACERDAGAASGQAMGFDGRGNEVFSTPGRSPRMVACDGGIALLTEQTSKNGVRLRVQRYEDGRETGSAVFAGRDEYTFNGNLEA